MTIDDMAKVLASLETPEERRDFLLMIADELPEPGAAELRTLVRRASVLPEPRPFDRKDRYDWNHERYDVYGSAVPYGIFSSLPPGHANSQGHMPVGYRVYHSLHEAWAALLRAVEVME